MLPQLARKNGRSRRDAGGFQRVAAGLVEDDAAEAARDDHGHFARRAIRRGEHRGGGLSRLAAGLRGIDAAVKQLKAHHRAGVARAGLILPAVAGDGGAEQAGVNARVAGVQPLAVGDEHMLLAGDQPGGNLHDARGNGAGGLIRLTQDVRAARGLHGEERRFDRVDIRMGALGQTHVARGFGRIGHGRRRAIRRAQQAGFAHVAGVDVNGAQTVVDAHACAVRAGERRVFNAPVAQGHGKIAGILDENFGERAAARQRAGKHALADR